MSERIWKYELKITDEQFVKMPMGSKILSVANQDGKLCLWALIIDPQADCESRRIEVIGTGNPIRNGSRKFIGTVVMNPFVWHVFERVD